MPLDECGDSCQRTHQTASCTTCPTARGGCPAAEGHFTPKSHQPSAIGLQTVTREIAGGIGQTILWHIIPEHFRDFVSQSLFNGLVGLSSVSLNLN